MKTTFTSIAFALTLASAASAQVMSPADYVKTAGASDLFERQSAAIVLKTTQDTKIKDFAMMMATDHAKSTAAVKSAAQKDGVKAAPPALTPAQQELIKELQAEKGAARDATYIAQQKAAHGQALNVQKAYADEGTSPALKSAAAGIVPVVQHHIKALMGM